MPLTWFDGVEITVEAALATAPPRQILNANPFFEASLSDWGPQGTGTAVARSTAQAHQGAASMLITPAGGVTQLGAITAARYPVTAGASYVTEAWVYCPAGWSDVRTCIDWYDAAGVFMNTGLGMASSIPAATWTFTTQTLVAPVGAASGRLRVRMGGTPPATTVLYADEAMMLVPAGGVGLWNSSTWDAATWGPDVVWQDISQWVRSIRTDRRFDQNMQVWSSGTADLVLLNQDGRFSPSNLAGPYVVAGRTSVRPWRPIRVRATYAGITYDLYRGYATDWLETWDRSDKVATVDVPCVDEWGRLARFAGITQTPVGAGDPSGRRVHRILDNAGHTGSRNIDPGRVTVQATDLSKNATDDLKTTVDSEGGGLFVDADGAMCFEEQYALLEHTRSNTVQCTFVDRANAAAGRLTVHDMSKSYGGNLVANVVSFQRVGGAVQVVDDPESRALSGDLAEKRTDLVCETDTQVRALATLYLQLRKDPEDRVKEIVVKPRARPAEMFPQILARRVRDLVRVIRTPRAGGYTIDQACHIAGVTHVIDKNDWTVTYPLSSATVFQTYANSRWDVARWDGAAFFF